MVVVASERWLFSRGSKYYNNLMWKLLIFVVTTGGSTVYSNFLFSMMMSLYVQLLTWKKMSENWVDTWLGNSESQGSFSICQ